MHVSGISLDLSWFLQFILTLFLIALGLLHIVKNTASKYFAVDDSFDHHPNMPGRPSDSCAVCGSSTTKNCAGCKAVRYCSANCQRSHWNSGHKQKCKELRLSRMENSMQPISLHCGSRGSEAGPSIGNTNIVKHSKEKILFPYEEFVDLFNWKGPEFPPCGLLNCGNSCFANVVLQCLSHTRPLFAYLLEKGHRRECRKTDWCFLCELQTHVERSSDRRHPFSPLNILSRLPNIGGNLGYGKQEDAHEFMRFAIDTMQSVCLDEFGGEKALHPSTQETTLIQHIFGGQLESQVICTKCNNISKQYENMMDLTVEIHGDAGSLEECLDQFTVREQLHGDNMYKCDGCNDYVMAWKRLTIRRAPNILTIALKRFQSGRFGKLNKRVTFPETLNLSPYMSEAGHGDDIYKLYAVVVHVDMLNASYFGHYICYIKGFCGNWYRIDDCKVTRADLEEVLSQGAYMLLYSRVSARPSCPKPIKDSSEGPKTAEAVEEEPSAEPSAECSTVTPPVASFVGSGSVTSDGNSSEEQKTAEVVEDEPSAECLTITSALGSESLPSDSKSLSDVSCSEMESSSTSHPEGFEKDTMMLNSDSSTSAPMDIEVYGNGHLNVAEESSPIVRAGGDGVLSSASETLKPEANSNGSAIFESSIQNINCAESSGRELTVSHIESPLPLVDVGSTSENSMPVQNGMCQKSEIFAGSSVDNLSSDVVLDDVNLAVCSRKPEEKITGNTSLNGVKKLAVKSPIRAKPKPLFARGFLEKPPRRKCLKIDAKSSSENAQHASSSNLINGISALAKSDLVSQNGSLMKETHSGSSTPVLSLNQQDGNCLENGGAVVSSSSEKVTDLQNGDSGASDNMEIDRIPCELNKGGSHLTKLV